MQVENSKAKNVSIIMRENVYNNKEYKLVMIIGNTQDMMLKKR